MFIIFICGGDLRRWWIVLDVHTVFEDISARSGWHQHALTCYPTFPWTLSAPCRSIPINLHEQVSFWVLPNSAEGSPWSGLRSTSASGGMHINQLVLAASCIGDQSGCVVGDNWMAGRLGSYASHGQGWAFGDFGRCLSNKQRNRTWPATRHKRDIFGFDCGIVRLRLSLSRHDGLFPLIPLQRRHMHRERRNRTIPRRQERCCKWLIPT